MEKFIEITQDCAGVIEKNNGTVNGFHTGGIQSCLVTVYECEKAYILIHDSGQLKISDICKLIKRYGKVQKITSTFGPNLNSEHHQQRFDKIRSKIGYDDENVDVLKCQQHTFSFQFPLNGKPRTSDNSTPSYVEGIPNKEKRISIVELNNFFLKPNSQKLGLDIQYIDGNYQSPRGLDYSMKELLKIVKRQPDFFFPNLAFLQKANEIGLVKVPKKLLSIADEYQVSQFMFRKMDSQEMVSQKNEFNMFIQSA